MKTYRLIKEYPGSPSLGTIKDSEKYIPAMEHMKDYPEFWEEVIEKDYEILSYITIESELIKYKDLDINDDLNCDKYLKIHSVKRLSDGEVFTIGDKIFPNNKIYKFELKNDILKIWHCDISFSTPIIEGPSGQPGNCSWIEGINNIKKSKQPLFTTEDGVDIFEGDNLYSIDNMLNIKKHLLFNARYDDNTLLNNRIFFNSDYKHFSTKEKAEEYILYNKPLLTLKDIEELLCKNTSSYFLEKFKKRAQKLNNKN